MSEKTVKITITIEQDVLGALRSALGIKTLSGNSVGIIDAFMKKMISKINNREEEWHYKYKVKE